MLPRPVMQDAGAESSW